MTTGFQGLAPLMTLAFRGDPLTEAGNRLLERAGAAGASPSDCANALMDLSIVLHLKGNHDIALTVQGQALKLSQSYTLPARTQPAIRLLALMTPGDLSANTPLEFLVEGSDIELTLLFLSPALPFPEPLPDHDVAFVAVGESESSQPLLRALADLARIWPRPLLNSPERIARLSRDRASALLQGLPGVVMPASVRVRREILSGIARCELALSTLLGDGDYPVILRPLDSHAGKGLIKADTPGDLMDYLETHDQAEFHLARFVDYRSPDGWFRKFRVALVDGKPFASHMAISDHWMIHYLNGGMTESPEKREEEARFMADFDRDFAKRHAQALQGIHQQAGLDYLIMDCAETPDGQLLVFEVDSSAVVHAMDPPDLFPYKQPQMRKVFLAFRALLERACKT